MSTPIPIEPHGIYDDVDERAYHAHPWLSASSAKLLARDGGPARFLEQQNTPPKPSHGALNFGSAAHSIVLGVGDEYERLPYEAWTTKAAKDAAQASWDAGRIPLKGKEYDKLHAMVDALMASPTAMEYLTHPANRYEQSAFRRDERTGIGIRGRFDILGEAFVADYKTAQTANPARWKSHAFDFGYDQQAAWYLDMAAALGHPVGEFVFIAQEKEAPYLVKAIRLDDEFLRIGHARNREAIDRYIACTESGEWPGYGDDVATISAPTWAAMKYPDTDAEEPATTAVTAGADLDPELEAALADLANEWSTEA